MTFDFLELFNAVAVKQKAVPTDFISAESLDTPIDEDSTGLDSLDITMVFVIWVKRMASTRSWTPTGLYRALVHCRRSC